MGKLDSLCTFCTLYNLPDDAQEKRGEELLDRVQPQRGSRLTNRLNSWVHCVHSVQITIVGQCYF